MMISEAESRGFNGPPGGSRLESNERLILNTNPDRTLVSRLKRNKTQFKHNPNAITPKYIEIIVNNR